MSIKYVAHAVSANPLYECSNTPIRQNARRMTIGLAVLTLGDLHACPECLGDLDDDDEEVIVMKKKYGAKWHRPDDSGVCRDCAIWVPEGRR